MGGDNPTCSAPALYGCEGQIAMWPYDYGHAQTAYTPRDPSADPSGCLRSRCPISRIACAYGMVVTAVEAASNDIPRAHEIRNGSRLSGTTPRITKQHALPRRRATNLLVSPHEVNIGASSCLPPRGFVSTTSRVLCFEHNLSRKRTLI